jgi:hypothetical protein
MKAIKTEKPEKVTKVATVMTVNAEAMYGKRPELKWLPITALYVDSTYQRNPDSKASKKNIAYIRENFSWRYFGVLSVCQVESKKQYAIVDGQHRYLAAKAMGALTELPCAILKIEEVEKQAENFVVINKRRVNMNSLADFHAAVAAGVKEARQLKALLDDCKITVPKYNLIAGATEPNEVQCVGTLVKMLGRHTTQQMKWGLTIIRDAYGEEKGIMRASLVKAMIQFITIHADADRGIMIQALQNLDPEKIEDDARAAVRVSGGTTQENIMMQIDRKYKSLLRKEK